MDGKTKGKTEFVTLDILTETLEIQNRAYRTAVQMLVDDVKSEARSLRKDFDNLKLSHQFTQGQVDDHKISETTKVKRVSKKPGPAWLAHLLAYQLVYQLAHHSETSITHLS